MYGPLKLFIAQVAPWAGVVKEECQVSSATFLELNINELSLSLSFSVSPSVSLPLSFSLLLVKERQVSLVQPLSFQAASQQNEVYRLPTTTDH